MKKISAFLLVLIMAMMLFAGCSNSESDRANDKSDDKKESENVTTEPIEIDYTLYIPYAQKALDTHRAVNTYTSAQGILYDIDANGIDELLLIHEMNSQGMPKCVYDVYTIEDNKVCPLIRDELFFHLAGGPDGDIISFKSDDGRSLIGFRYTEINPGYEEELYYLGTWAVYEISGTEITEIKRAEYTYVTENDVIDYSRSTAVVDSTEIPYKEFQDWTLQYHSKEILNAYGYDVDNNLENLLKSLEN